MKIAIAQVNPVIADIEYNTKKILEYIAQAKQSNVELIIFPEMVITGYPPMDLLENKNIILKNMEALDLIVKNSGNIAIILGYLQPDSKVSPSLYNAAVFINNGRIEAKQYKTLLPTYDVFDEHRYFSVAKEYSIINFNNKKIGITICEDIWNIEEVTPLAERKYQKNPVEILLKNDIDLLINLSASPYVRNKNSSKWEIISELSKKNKLQVLYANQVGGNDSLIFDGCSFLTNKVGEIIAAASKFSEDLLITDTDSNEKIILKEDLLQEIEDALVLGIKDYVKKCGFKNVLLGLSGGIDSALVAVLAVKALGPGNVLGITMPSQYSSKGSIDDSVKLARNLGIRIEEISIKELFDQYNKTLSSIFKGYSTDVTEENIQARIRGNILMAASNKFGSLLLTTGNKSELAMGYCTLYGDMSGGLAVISDLPKTLVYKIAKFINREKEIIPLQIITKPPSAELREDQKDQDTLPDYEILDGILEAYIEKKMSFNEIIDFGYNKETVMFVLKCVDLNEYKRRQAAPGLKITSKAFGSGRRIPIAQRMKH